MFFLLLLIMAWPRSLRADFQGSTHIMPFDEEGINYGKTKETNRVSRLIGQVNSGEVTLRFDEHFGYLPSVLEALKISTNSQMLVFSKTSLSKYGSRTMIVKILRDNCFSIL